MSNRLKLVLLTVVTPVLVLLTSAASAESHPGSEAFIDRVVEEYGLDEEYVRNTLNAAEYQQSIIDAITRPAESKPWHEYRPIFLGQARIDGGVEFWRANQSLIDQIVQEMGVPPEIIMAIVGVETRYGMITGSFRVLDALTTLGFYYPRRAEFFSRELGKYFQLAEEENLELTEVKGSYAGAMGIGQFIPSSYRAYAVDFDDSGTRDLWRSLPDALGSVANYLKVHGWQADAPIVLPVLAMPADWDRALPIKPEHTLGSLADMGIDFNPGDLALDTPATIIELEAANGPEYWIGLNNFYVITRYNRSPLYAMAVTQLSEAIAERAAVALESESGS